MVQHEIAFYLSATELTRLHTFEPFIQELATLGRSLPGHYPVLALYHAVEASKTPQKKQIDFFNEYPELLPFADALTHLQGEKKDLSVFRGYLTEQIGKMYYELNNVAEDERTISAFRQLPTPSIRRKGMIKRVMVKKIFGNL